MAKVLLRRTETLEVWKIYGTGSSDTIALATDCLSPTMEISGTPTVNITAVMWYASSGASDGVTITRNAVPILNLYQNGNMDMGGNGGFVDNVQNTQNIVVSIVGTGGCYLTLRKAAGYASKIETAQFGAYDNTTTVGS
jgi:hypothetical protein